MPGFAEVRMPGSRRAFVVPLSQLEPPDRRGYDHCKEDQVVNIVKILPHSSLFQTAATLMAKALRHRPHQLPPTIVRHRHRPVRRSRRHHPRLVLRHHHRRPLLRRRCRQGLCQLHGMVCFKVPLAQCASLLI